MATKKTNSKRASSKKANSKKTKKKANAANKRSAKLKLARAKNNKNRSAARKPAPRAAEVARRRNEEVELVKPNRKGPGPEVLSGDVQGLSFVEDVTSESVEELVSEGQGFEAGFVSGVEDAPAADGRPIKTREVPEDDVPPEYDDPDRP